MSTSTAAGRIRTGDLVTIVTREWDWWPNLWTGGDRWEEREVTRTVTVTRVTRDQYGTYVEYVAPSNNGMLWNMRASTILDTITRCEVTR